MTENLGQLFICVIRLTRTESLPHNTQTELIKRIRVRLLFEEGLSVIIASTAVDILMAFFYNNFYFFPCWVSRKLINYLSLFSKRLNNYFD